jgi:hypothetical protein
MRSVFILVPRKSFLLLVGAFILIIAVGIGTRYGWWIPVAALSPFLLFVLASWFLSVGYPYLRGVRNRDQGIPCVTCGKVAFPLEGSRTRYRCWSCGCRFDGPAHL